MALFNLGGWRRKANRNGVTETPTFKPNQNTITLPVYREHMMNLYTERQYRDSRSLLKDLFKSDPDVSAAVNAYLTVANTEPRIFVRDATGAIDREGHEILHQILNRLTLPTDFSSGFEYKPSFQSLCAELRYMLLLRGAIGTELVFDRTYAPAEIRQVDMASIRWEEKSPGKYKPKQLSSRGGEISLDVPTFFVSFFRRDPTSIYTTSHFVAAINTIAARQQLINDLYRIMYVTGFPRISIKVLEEAVRNAAPASVKSNPNEERAWLLGQLQEIGRAFGSLRADQAFLHFDSVEPSVINDKNPGSGIDISSVVDVLNGQNQAALKVMATIIGRGESGVNTASVEARIFALNADELNVPLAENLSRLLTFAMAMQGRQNVVEVSFWPVELRPWLELENQLSMKQSRLLEALSLGIISDDEFHIQMYGRPRPDDAPTLSGTGFHAKKITADPTEVTPNADPLGRSLAPNPGGN